MSHSAAVVLPHAGILAAPVPRNRGALPPVCPPPEPRRRTPTSSSPSWPQVPPRLRVMTPLLPRQSAGGPPPLAQMFFPSGSDWLKIPHGPGQRVSPTEFLCRLRATKTLIR